MTAIRRRNRRLVIALLALVALAAEPGRDVAPADSSPLRLEGGNMSPFCAALHLFLCGPWWPRCPQVPSGCYESPRIFGL